MPGRTFSRVSRAAVAGLLIGTAQALFHAFLMIGGPAGQGPAGEGPAVGPVGAMDLGVASIAFVGLVGALSGGLIWWLFVARRDPAGATIRRGVVIGGVASVAAMIVLDIVNALILLASGLRTEPAGSGASIAELAGLAAPLLLAGILLHLLWGWPVILAGMMLGGALVSWFRRGAPSVPSGEFDPSRQAPAGRRRCDGCGVEYPSHRYLTPAGSRGHLCRACAVSGS